MTMNGQMNGRDGRDGRRDNQLGWQQFSHQIRQRENQRAVEEEECRFNMREEQDAKFVDVEVSTPRRSGGSGGGIGGMTRRRVVVKFQLAAAVEETPTTTTTTTGCYEVVQKPKTRAARRAMEEEEEEDTTTPAIKPRRERERRSDYWVQQHDKFRSAARTFKMTAAQLAVGGE
jgi:hypothetical protein